jgi:hypothetical protein
MNIIQLINAKAVFVPHIQEKLTPSLSYKIYKLCRFVEQEENFYNTTRRNIIEEFAERNENGVIINNDGMINIIPDKIDEAQKAMTDLNEIDVDVPNVKFTLDELSEIKLSVQDIAVLDGFIEE